MSALKSSAVKPAPDADAGPHRVHRRVFKAMGSPNEIVVAGAPLSEAVHATAAAELEVRRIERKYTRYREHSVVSRINARAGLGGLVVDTETARLLDFAAQLHQQSEGLFDITSGCLRRVWDFRTGQVPADSQIDEVLTHIGWRDVAWDGRQIALPRPGMEIDLGGIGKEYAADRAAAVLAGLGVRHGFVNLGGDLRVLGPRPDGRPWRFAVQHPRQADATVGHIDLSGGALATSGDYERFFITPEGRRCCHILNPRTGQPVNHWQAVSVVAPVCLAAGALATMAMLIGAQAPSLLNTPGIGFLLVGPDGHLRSHDPEQLLHLSTPS